MLAATSGIVPCSAQDLDLWIARPDIRIGSVDDPRQALTAPGPVVVGPDGRIYVSQPMEGQVRVYDRDGKFLDAIGNRGEGPAEFEAITSMGVIGDTLYVTDSRLLRITYFSLDGSLLGSERLASPLIDGRYHPNVPASFFRDRTALVEPILPLRMLANGTIRRVPYVRIAPDGARLNIVAWKDVSPSAVPVQVNGRTWHVPLPVQADPLYVPLWDGSGLMVVERRPPDGGDEGMFTVVKIEATGDTQFVRKHPYQPSVASDEVVESRLNAFTEALARRTGASPAASSIREALEAQGYLPRFLEPITDVVSTVDGGLWLRRERGLEADVTWLVLDRSGAQTAEILLPRSMRVLAVSRSTLIALEHDEYDVPYLRGFRIDHGRSGSEVVTQDIRMRGAQVAATR